MLICGCFAVPGHEPLVIICTMNFGANNGVGLGVLAQDQEGGSKAQGRPLNG